MRRTFLLMIIMIFAGCTHVINKYRVEVDAISSVNVIPSTYVIEPLRDDIDELKFQRESRKLARILNEKGFKEVQYKNLAEQIIYFDYGIEVEREEINTYTEPEIGFGFSWGYPYRGYYRDSFWSDIEYRRYRTFHKRYKIYNRYITIISKNQSGKELWRVDISSIGESNDIHKIIPILLETAKDYIGKNLDKPINIDIDEDPKIEEKNKKE
jgi:hypothetical protein